MRQNCLINAMVFNVVLVSLTPLICYAGDSSAPETNDATTIKVLEAAKIAKDEKYHRVSIIQLIADPEKYDSEKIEVFGYFMMTKEWQALYFDEAAYENSNESNALGIDLTDGKYANATTNEIWDFNCRYGLIRGVFVGSTSTKGDSVHLGEITHVQFISVAKNKGYCISQK